MSFDDTINVYFVSVEADEISKDDEQMKTALSLLHNHVPDDHIRQIPADEGFPLIASGRLSKKDVFVFDKFDGEFFDQLQLTKSLIIGPRCLCSCLLKCEPIPLGTSPVFTTAMRNLQISASGVTPQAKERLRIRIQWMGGHYFHNFGRSITHLISNTIKSTKYEHATLNGIPVMHVDWVQRVWEKSCVEDVNATDEEFNTYRLPIFFGTNITCTGLDVDKRNEVMRCVNENGGTYHRAFRSQLVDIVITEKNKTNSEKYEAAVRYKKEILTPEWIFDSVEKGFALPTKSYQVKALKVSTPTRTDQSIADFTSTDQTQLSDISQISAVGSKQPRADVTISDTIYLMNESRPQTNLQRAVVKKTIADANYKQIYDEICPKQAKKAGTFLDGCCIFLSGFLAEEKEKLNKILNVGGATRYDVVNEKITHIIVGKLDDAEFKAWKKDGTLSAVNIVRLSWLLESINLKQPASEVVHRVALPTSQEPDIPSPSSKRTLRSMNHSFKQPELPVKKKLFGSNPNTTQRNRGSSSSPIPEDLNLKNDEQNIIAHYSKDHEPIIMPPPAPSTQVSLSTQVAPISSSDSNPPPPPAIEKNPTEMANTGMSTIDYEHLDFFRGLSVYIDKAHFPEEFYSQMINECEAAQGNVVVETFRDPVDYVVVSFECTVDESKLPVKARHIVTELYVETCMKQNKLMPIEYYHKHIPHTADAIPLRGMTIVISVYTGLERDFIDSLAQLLGAKVNKTFVKKEKPLLICPSPEGSKYQGALKWRYPVVVSEWLVHCAVEGKKLPYKNYIVGESVEDFPISPALKERNVNVEPVETSVTPSNQDRQPMQIDVLENKTDQHKVSTPTAAVSSDITAFTPLRNKRVSELMGYARNTGSPLANANSSPTSPHTPPNSVGRPTHNFDIMENILNEIENEAERECLREIITEMRNNQTPELERIRRQACTPINRKIPTPKGIPDFCTTPEFEKRMADEFERRWRLPTKKMKPDTPIEEIRKRIIRATCEAMGLLISSDEDWEQQNRQEKICSSEENQVRKSKDQSTPFRSGSSLPRQIFAESKTPQNLSPSDTLVPGTQTPNSSNKDSSLATEKGLGQHAYMGSKSTINFDKISFEETSIETKSNSVSTNAKEQSIAASSPELKQITDYLKNCQSRRQSLRQRSSGTGAETASKCGEKNMETEAQYVQPFESEQFGAGTDDMVVWRDPAEFHVERNKLSVRSMQYKGTPRFSISCSEEETRADLISKIISLGGEVSENLVNFDPECTHFLCERPNRGEKMLGCISSGKWILSLKYIAECCARGIFVDEELFEWGNNKACNNPIITQDELVIASAAHRWRKQLNSIDSQPSNESVGAFSSFRAILRIPDRNLAALKNVIKAGKGEIIEAQPPYRNYADARRATHCFVDVKKVPLTKPDYEFLQQNGVKVLTQMYINSYLMNGSSADFSKYEINM